MNLTTTNASATMSSREIAELTGKRHDHVKRDIRNMCKQLEIDSAQFCAQYRDGSGRTFPCFNLNFHLASTLIAGYSSKARMAIISRLEEKAVIDAINEFEVPDDIPDMYVYAIRETETGRVKLGINVHIENIIGHFKFVNGVDNRFFFQPGNYRHTGF